MCTRENSISSKQDLSEFGLKPNVCYIDVLFYHLAVIPVTLDVMIYGEAVTSSLDLTPLTNGPVVLTEVECLVASF